MRDFDPQRIAEYVKQRMSGVVALPSSVLGGEATHRLSDVDVYAEMEKRAKAYMEDVVGDAHEDVVSLDGIEADVFSPSVNQKRILRMLSSEKRTALKSIAEASVNLAERLDAKGLAKQAADLRAVAKKIS